MWPFARLLQLKHKMDGHDKIYRSTAQKEYKLTDGELDSLPCEYVTNPKYRSGPPARLYLSADVEALASSPAVQERLKKKAMRDDPVAKEARRLVREARITKRFASWRDALPRACQAMFNLNRYAKHNTCRCKHEIYALKNGLIDLLYRNGFCTECKIHTDWLPEKVCFACDGAGWRYGWESDEQECERCGGTGIYLPAKELRFIAFRFLVDGQHFAWHQPDYLVTFPFLETGPTESGGLADEKPIEMSTEDMRKGRVIVRYVLAEANKSSAA